jgi:hypothetical protein
MLVTYIRLISDFYLYIYTTKQYSMRNLFFVLLFSSVLVSCKEKKDDNNNGKPDIDKTLGYGMLTKLPGIWNGGVASSTALGSYPEWIVDFRPVSTSQVSAKNELDSLNNIFMSVFIVLHNNEYKLCFRNGGGFAGYTRVSYLLIDSFFESTPYSYYRFSEVVKGKSRAYSEFIFKDDSLILRSYTNKTNSLSSAVLHMDWRAKIQDKTTAQPAISNFGFPKKEMVKDFSSTFSSLAESIFYNDIGDPYTNANQPYLGKTTVAVSYAGGLSPDPSKKTLLMISAQPLINGATVNTANYKYRSRYVLMPGSSSSFVFDQMHPGTYYVYALHDRDGNLNFSSGDYVSTANTSFTLAAKSNSNAAVQINFQIP